MIALYPTGIPTMYFVLLFRNRRILQIPKEDRTDEERKVVAHLSFIAGAYKPEFWYASVRMNRDAFYSRDVGPLTLTSATLSHTS
jgi:hypothetical protein